MAILVSPGIQVNEVDFTNVIPAVSTSIGGCVGDFRWGPIDELTTISSEKDLGIAYGIPDAARARSFLTAASFLKYGNTLKVSRTAGNDITLKNSKTDASAAPAAIKNKNVFDNLSSADRGFMARYPGAIGDSLAVYLVTANTAKSNIWAQEFDYIPSSTTVNSQGVSAPLTFTGIVSNASPGIGVQAAPTITIIPANTNIKVGMLVTGNGISPLSHVVAVAGTTDVTTTATGQTASLILGLSTATTMAHFAQGMAIAGSGIEPGTIIDSVNAASYAITLSKQATTATGQTVTATTTGNKQLSTAEAIRTARVASNSATTTPNTALTLSVATADSNITTGSAYSTTYAGTSVIYTGTVTGVSGASITLSTAAVWASGQSFTFTAPVTASLSIVMSELNTSVKVGQTGSWTIGTTLYSGAVATSTISSNIQTITFVSIANNVPMPYGTTITFTATGNSSGGPGTTNLITLSAANMELSAAMRLDSSLGSAIQSIVAGRFLTMNTETSRASGTLLTFYSSGTTISISQPTVAEFAENITLTFTSCDEIHVLVVDKGGLFSGVKGTILERYAGLSLHAEAKKIDGQRNYYRDVINKESGYIYALGVPVDIIGGGVAFSEVTSAGIGLPNAGVAGGKGGEALSYVFTAGADVSLTDVGSGGPAQLVSSEYDLFRDAETVDVNFLFTTQVGESAASYSENELIAIAHARRDVVTFISAPIDIGKQTSDSEKLGLITNAGGTAKFDKITRSSYVVLDSSPLYIYNKYQDNYIWISAAGHVAGLCAYTDSISEPWISPAGYTRGQLLGVTKLGFNPNQAARDTLYKYGVNPIVTFPGQGTILFGDKTSQAKASAFDRINVRRLFITLEKACSRAAKSQLFELNDQFTRSMFRNMIEPYLRDVKARRGVTDFYVVCDERNNTSEVIDSNRFVADIYIKPAHSINFITLNFIATRSGVSFNEIIGVNS